MKLRNFLCCILLVLILPAIAVSAPKSKGTSKSKKDFNTDCEWKLNSEEENIKTFSSCRKNTRITQFKAETVLEFPIEVLLEVLTDVPSYHKWMPDVSEATILKEFHNGMERGNFYIHLIFDSQWPVADRDVVVETIPKTDWNKGISTVTLRKLHNFSFPMKKGLVRMDDLDSEFKFEYIERSKTKVIFTTFVDVGGSISPKLARVQTEPIPHETLVGLGKIAKDKKYFEAAAKEYY